MSKVKVGLWLEQEETKWGVKDLEKLLESLAEVTAPMGNLPVQERVLETATMEDLTAQENRKGLETATNTRALERWTVWETATMENSTAPDTVPENAQV